MRQHIQSKNDIHQFLDSLYGYELMPDPWTDFKDFVNLKTGERTFSNPLATELNRIMAACMRWCEREGLDIADVIHQHFWDNWAVKLNYHLLFTHCELEEDYFESRMAT